MLYKSDEREVIIKSRYEARRDYENFKGDLYLLLVLATLSWFIALPLVFVLLGFIAVRWYRFYKEYFADPLRKKKYSLELAPQLAYATYLNVGYEIDDYMFDKHLEMLKRLDAKDKEAVEYLKRMTRWAKAKRYPLVGVSKNQLTTHFWIIGTTGAGKTSFIMQLVQLLADLGGGLIFIDGKADVKTVYKLYNILKSVGRENDFLLINFLPREEFREHTNTFNPIANMSYSEIVEFLMSTMGDVSGDRAYWAERGKALMQAITAPLYYRQKYSGERFTLTTIYSYLSDLNAFLFLQSVLYTTVLTEEEKLKQIKGIDKIVAKVKEKKALDIVVPTLDAVVFYFTLHPYEKQRFPEIDVDKYRLLHEAYTVASAYTKQISQQLWDAVSKMTNDFLKVLEKENLDISAIDTGRINMLMEKNGISVQKYINMAAMQTALQQHAYAQQQWTAIFGTLMQYSNIFGSNESEIDMVDVLKNNKFLYVLLPALKASPNTTNLLGKLFITAIRKAVSTALGERVEGLTKEQREILTRRITPIPLGLVVLDEYGAYPVAGIDTLLAQVRSINISVILSTQDYTSARAEGKDENAVKRAWANTQKIVLRIKDNETMKMLDEVMPERYRGKFSYVMEKGYEFARRESVSFEKEKAFDIKVASGFRNGLGVFITDERAVLTQIFYADAEESEEIFLNHTKKFS